MMGHFWRHDGEYLIAAKGSPERIMTLCDLNDTQKEEVRKVAEKMSNEGLRVIAVAENTDIKKDSIHENLTDAKLTLLGLIGLVDPPRESVKEDIEICNKAGIRVVMITGDNGLTSSAIAKKVGIKGCENIITGEMIDKMSDEKLRKKVKTVSIFSGVIPEHKMRIVKAFRENGESCYDRRRCKRCSCVKICRYRHFNGQARQ